MSSRYALENVVGGSLQLDETRSYEVKTKAVRLGRDVVDDVGALAYDLLPAGNVLLIADRSTYPLVGREVEASLRNGGFRVRRLVLHDGDEGKVEADQETLELVEGELTELLEPRAGLVALGSGTLNDLAKLAAFHAGLSYGVVTTAASMNGYTSAIAAILAGGVKRTISCAPPVFVVADLELVASAPAEMARAGFGDLLSKPVSSGDWMLSHLLEGERFFHTPVRLVEAAFARVQAQPRRIGEGDPEALGVLMEALLLSGISMASAGSSAPASGGEHLISHLWDMTAPYRGRKTGLHGAQVGVATLVTATLYQHLRELSPTRIQPEARVMDLLSFEEYRRRLEQLPGPIVASVEEESRQKYPQAQALASRLEEIRQRWDSIWQGLDPFLQSPERLRDLLGETGAPTTVRALGIPETELREAYRIARDIRARYTVLDFAWQLGVLEALEEDVLARSGVLG